jgi:acetyl-CoA carboxylase biotin carboxyl carrier protein
MIDLAKLERMMNLMQQYGVDFVQAEQGNEKFFLSRSVPQGFGIGSPATTAAVSGNSNGSSQHTNSSPSVTLANPAASSETTSQGASVATKPAGSTQTCPVVGTFYSSPSPDAKHFVQVGSKVKKGQTLCIVEAMKLMNEIESEFDGTIVEVLVENGKPVEFGTPLFIIAP